MDYFNQTSERLLYRKLEEADIKSWAEFFIDNDSLPYLGIPDLSKSNEALAEEWIVMQFERYKTIGLGHLATIEKSSGKFIGMCGIIPREVKENKEFEIAYSLKPTFWGKGYGTEMATQMKTFGLQDKIANRFISIIDKRNTASIHVAKKNGMTILYDTEYLGMDVFVFGTDKK